MKTTNKSEALSGSKKMVKIALHFPDLDKLGLCVMFQKRWTRWTKLGEQSNAGTQTDGLANPLPEDWERNADSFPSTNLD